MFTQYSQLFSTPNQKQEFAKSYELESSNNSETLSQNESTAISKSNNHSNENSNNKCNNNNFQEVSQFHNNLQQNQNFDFYDKLQREYQNPTQFSKKFSKNSDQNNLHQYKDSQMIKIMESMVLNNNNQIISNQSSQFESNYLEDITMKKKNSNKKQSDRFIPNRKTSKLSIALTSAHNLDEKYYKLINDPDRLKGKDINESQQVSILEMYKSHVLGINNKTNQNNIDDENNNNMHQQNIFSYQDENSYGQSQQNFGQNNSNRNQLCSLQEMVLNKNNIVKQYDQKKIYNRKISKIPFKVLDAPQLQDDFYLNLIEWSSQNQLAVALASCVYLWSAQSNKVIKFCDLGNNDMVTSIQWNPAGTLLGIGTSQGELQIWDAHEIKKLAVLGGHSARIGSLAWSNSLLSSGSRDKTILQRDLRSNNDFIKRLQGHKQEVCGLKWSFDGQQLASGGNDNKLLLWNMKNEVPVAKFTSHTAAVKALAWSPHQHSLLASGGGTADRTIRFWNTNTHEQVNYIDTGSQVCNLMFAKNVNELVSTHGYSMNQICLWKYPTMEKIADLYGHTSRVLFLASNPSGDTIVTGAGDETLRFWKLFPEQQQRIQSSILVSNMSTIR